MEQTARKQLGARVDTATWSRLKAQAAREGLPAERLLDKSMETYLKKYGEGEPNGKE